MTKASILVRNLIYKVCSLISSKRPTKLILSYHSIGDPTWKYSVAVEDFKFQINYLLSLYKSSTLQSLFNNPNPEFVLTFDDGYKDILIIRDFLKEKGIYPTIFLLSDPDHADKVELGNSKELLTTDEIKTLLNDGWEIGSHGATHRDFWMLSHDDLVTEVIKSKEVLQKEYGCEIKSFSYPRGRYTNSTMSMLKVSGYINAVSMDDSILTSTTDPLCLARVGVDSTHTPEVFKETILCTTIYFREFIKNCFGGVFRRFL